MGVAVVGRGIFLSGKPRGRGLRGSTAWYEPSLGQPESLMVYSAEPRTPSATALTVLGTLAATVAQPS